jgi:hypothetical protein
MEMEERIVHGRLMVKTGAEENNLEVAIPVRQ